MQMPEKLKILGIFILNIMDEHIVKVNFGDVYWNVTPIEIEEPKTCKKLVRLEWGWGAGLTDEQRIECEEDGSPAGYESVTMTLDGVGLLVSSLVEILEKYPDESKIGKYIVDYIEGKQPKNEES